MTGPWTLWSKGGWENETYIHNLDGAIPWSQSTNGMDQCDCRMGDQCRHGAFLTMDARVDGDQFF